MNTSIFLIRHGESLKNTLNAYSTISGKEPLTKFGIYQSESAANYLLHYYRTHKLKSLALYAANDKRSIESAFVISKKLQIQTRKVDELSAFVSINSSGKIADYLYEEEPEFGKKVHLYRAGLLSAYDVPWPAGNTKELERKLQLFLESNLLVNNRMTMVVSHKSIITCLSVIMLKKYGNYPKDYHGYIDIPIGTGFLFEINDNMLTVSQINFVETKKKTKTDVILRDGIIVFPESACAVCWKNNCLLLVNQDRPNKKTWELPGGKIELLENPIDAAVRELKEETGISAEGGELVYSLDLDLSISFHRTHLVEFKNISAVNENDNSNNTKWISLEDIEQMIAAGDITHAPTIVAFLKRSNIRKEGGRVSDTDI